MDELKISTGKISIKINRDGENVGVFSFNPDNISEVKRHAEIVQQIEEHQEALLEEAQQIDENGTTLEQTTFTEKIVLDLYNKIDAVYGEGTSALVFGDCVNPEIIISFFSQLQPYYTAASEKRKQKYTKK